VAGGGIHSDMSEVDGLPSPQRQWVMTCVLLGVVLINLDGAIANIALPTMAHDFATSEAATVWVVNSYQLAVAVCLLPAATLGEILGLKRVYAFGLILFTIASLLCALSPTLGTLVGARLLQGVGGSCVAALGPALVRIIYPRRIVAQGFGLIALFVAMSGALGPTIAALILSVGSWPWLFLVNLPVCLVAAPLFIAMAPQSPSQARPFDFSGALLNAVALGLVVIGVGSLGGHNAALGIGEIIGGLVCVGLLVRQQSRRTTPLLPLDLLRIPVFALSIGTSICSYTAQILAYISLPFLFQTVMHRSPVATGLLVTPWPLLVAVAAPLAGRLSGRYPPAILGSIGLTVLAFGLLLLVALPTAPTDWNIAWRMAVCGVGFGFFQTPNNTILMMAGPIARSAAASGLVATARTIGWSLGAALVALIFAAQGSSGTIVCLGLGAGFAVAGAALSVARIASRR
jgi:DHA2 family multidrug resistance protein-like MFS transporter